jgi:hypothetical protein
MTVTDDELMSAARAKLIASPYVAPLIGVDIGQDSMFPNTYDDSFTDAWIFRGEGSLGVPVRNPRSLGVASVSLVQRNPFSFPNLHNTMRFRQLQVFIWTDMTRAGNSPDLYYEKDAEDRCDRIASAIIQELNDTANRDHWWGNTFITSCTLGSDLTMDDVVGTSDADNLIVGEIRFNLVLD